MEMGKSNIRPMWEYKMGEEIIMKRNEEKDLGKTLTNIRMVFIYMDKSMIKKIISVMIRLNWHMQQ
ncbi:hypothetical protein E2C01_044658 [Portunus trituberculatus]|uniref:Uncharacterized protein n=1 Tax=Portunus trituberculatus TaxID=210409 RepID=A0A5B7G2X1_PORTR|nr:hypothetical protein [Portunus trituberculatus]